MNETSLSRRGAFAKVLGGLAALAVFRHTPDAPACAVARQRDFEPSIGTSTFTYDEHNRLLSVVMYDRGRATTIAN